MVKKNKLYGYAELSGFVIPDTLKYQSNYYPTANYESLFVKYHIANTITYKENVDREIESKVFNTSSEVTISPLHLIEKSENKINFIVNIQQLQIAKKSNKFESIILPWKGFVISASKNEDDVEIKDKSQNDGVRYTFEIPNTPMNVVEEINNIKYDSFDRHLLNVNSVTTINNEYNTTSFFPPKPIHYTDDVKVGATIKLMLVDTFSIIDNAKATVRKISYGKVINDKVSNKDNGSVSINVATLTYVNYKDIKIKESITSNIEIVNSTVNSKNVTEKFKSNLESLPNTLKNSRGNSESFSSRIESI